MKPALWNQFRWNDPNLRWGNPSYLLEPGDPDYVAPEGAPILSNPKPKTNKMPKSDYLPDADDLFRDQLNDFKLNIGTHAAALEVKPAEVTAQAADAAYFDYVLQCQAAVQKAAQQWTAWKELAREGSPAPMGESPLPPIFPTAVPAVAFGIEVRFRALVQRIKKHANYHAAIGEALGIEGAELSGPDFATFGPVLKLRLEGGE